MYTYSGVRIIGLLRLGLGLGLDALYTGTWGILVTCAYIKALPFLRWER